MEVRAREKCKFCKGERIIQNPVWAEFWALPNAIKMTREQTEQWFRENGHMLHPKKGGLYGERFEGFPDEEVTCWECDGTGYTEEWMDFAEFIALCTGVPKAQVDK